MWLTDLVAPRHVGSSWTRARIRVPCIGRQILNHCATREALENSFNGCIIIVFYRLIIYLTLPLLLDSWVASLFFVCLFWFAVVNNIAVNLFVEIKSN